MATHLRVNEGDTADESPPQAPARRGRLRLILVAVLVLAAAVWGVQKYLYSRTHVSTDNAQVDGHLTPIAPKVQAFVDSVWVDDNQPVHASDTLVTLDARDLQLHLRLAEADLASALSQAGSNGRAGQAQAQLMSSRASAASADAAVTSAEADARKAEADLGRYKTLAAQHIISPQQLDAAQSAYEVATARLEATRRQAAAMSSNVASAEAALRGASARVAAAQSAVDNARLQLSYAVITAPDSGIIAKRSVEPGELVQVGQDLMTLVPVTDVWVTANLKETQLEHVQPGQPASFTVDAYGGHEFQGTVESISPATGAKFALLPPDNATGNFTKVVQRVPVRIRVTRRQAGYPLRPGMSVEVTINTKAGS